MGSVGGLGKIVKEYSDVFVFPTLNPFLPTLFSQLKRHNNI